MKKVLAAVAASAMVFTVGLGAATIVTEKHKVVVDPKPMTTTIRHGIYKHVVVQNPKPITTTITDKDTYPDATTVTQTVTVTTGTTTTTPPPTTTTSPTTTTTPDPPPPPTGCSTTVAPGGNLNAAYTSVPNPGVICLTAGNYGIYSTPDNLTKDVTFRGVFPGTVFRQFHVGSDNVHLEYLEIRGTDSTDPKQYPQGPIMGTNGYKNFSFKHGKISRARDHMMVLVGGVESAAIQLNPLFDDIVFSDLEFSGLVPDAHGECMYSQASGLTIRNSTFKNCWVMDLMITRGDWWGQEVYRNVRLENNVFWHSVHEDGGPRPGWHYYGLLWHGNMEGTGGAIVKNNWFENSVEPTAVEDGTGNVFCGNNTGIMPAGFDPYPDAVPSSWKTPC
jgi:hypothetical protein